MKKTKSILTENDPMFRDFKKSLKTSSDKAIQFVLDYTLKNNTSDTVKIMSKLSIDELNQRKTSKQSDNWLDDVFGDE